MGKKVFILVVGAFFGVFLLVKIFSFDTFSFFSFLSGSQEVFVEDLKENRETIQEDEEKASLTGSSPSFILEEKNLGNNEINSPEINSPSGEISVQKDIPQTVTLFSGRIGRGDTLYEILRQNGLSPQKIYLISKALKPYVDPKKCRPGEKLELQKSKEKDLITLKYFPGGFYFYVVEEKEPGFFTAEKEKVPVEKVLVGAKGEIESSLYESMRKEEIPNELILKFADIFSWEIDFLTDPRRGDSFFLIWERYLNKEGKILAEGNILAARYVNQGKIFTAIFYQDPEGSRGYYTPEGKSLQRSFLKSPLNYRRISSYFSYRRFHPILKMYRPHLGIDYAAPTGTPVCSIGDGVIVFAGWKGGFGKYVEIKHPNGYKTSYGHLSRIAEGIKRGKRVSQGQVIGYVGSTGLATGPHLDFRISKNGRYLNFLKLDFPRANPIKAAYIDDFKKIKDIYAYYLDVLSGASKDVLVLHREEEKEEKA